MSSQQVTCKFIIGKKSLLTLCGSCSAGIGLLMLSLSLTTNNWITTYERVTRYNVTTVVAINSGLWRKCWRSRDFVGMTKATLWNDGMKGIADDVEKNCSFISYFKDKSKSTAELTAPEGILYEMRTAAIFPLIGFVVLVIGCSISALSFCDMKLKKCIFIASGFYVLSGVFLLIGIVLYVGSISQAFDIKNNDSDSEKQYFFDYGLSFYLSVISFILTEFSGVFCIYLYIAKRKHLHKEIIKFEELKRPKVIDNNINCLNFNRHRPWIPIDNRSEISPTSQISHQTYPFNRRCSDQMLLKLQHADISSIQYHPQYCYPSPQHDNLGRFSTGNTLNSHFISEYRADKPSPLLPLAIRDSKENMSSLSPHVVFFSEMDVIENTNEATLPSLILNKCTYFDSPVNEVEHENTSIINNIFCKTCNLPQSMCNCNCALITANNNSNHFKQSGYSQLNACEKPNLSPLGKEHYVNFSSNTITNVSKPRKITAV